jgi:hypothetical protein
MKTLASILAILVVLLSIALFLLGGAYRDCRNLKSEQFDFAKIEAIEHLHQMGRKDMAIAVLTKRLDSAMRSHAETQAPLIARLNSLKSTLRKSRIVDTVFSLRDTIIFVQDTLIDDLQKEKADVWTNFSQQVDTLKDKVRLSEDYAHVLEGSLKESIAEKAALDRKWRRKRRVERVLEIGGVVLIVIASI